MSRIRRIGLEDATDDVALLYDAATKLIGRVPNFYRVLANSPLVAKMLLPLNVVLQREGAGSLLSSRIKEMVIIKTSTLNGCQY